PEQLIHSLPYFEFVELTLIYYGMQIISPKVFLISTCIICGIVSLMVGSSWTTVATIGIALMGIGKALGFSDGWIAGAIISGAYFGDKMSPLSDTTVLASSMVGTPLFVHIRYMIITVVPSIAIALIVYLVAGFLVTSPGAVDINGYTTALASKYNMSLWLLLVPLFTGVMIYKRLPAIVVLFVFSVIAIVFALIFQPHILVEIEGGQEPSALVLLKACLRSFYGSTSVSTGNPEVDGLLASRGMAGMLNTIWLILCAMCFGGAMKASGMLTNIVSLITCFTRTRFGLVSSTVVSGIFLNTTVSDQYLSIMLSSSMFKGIYEKERYEPRLLSRSIEDSCTVTSVLVPWNTCGMTQSTVLNVPTFVYFPYCIFNIISPLMSIIISISGYKIYRYLQQRAGYKK
ncbi:MAG: Na+/H+ antiporter NhaC family protein, partial [Phocaeicola sp.]|uniref:Na+/H+ antiporter NhaC family protein n=1 Tax=Phocaeicola sp. TaxID=2773926 RepID=UPI003F9F2106